MHEMAGDEMRDEIESHEDREEEKCIARQA